MRILRTGVFIHTYIFVYLRRTAKILRLLLQPTWRMLTKVKAESRKLAIRNYMLRSPEIINPYYFKLMVSCIRVGKQDTILGNSWLSPTNPGECHVPVRTRD